MSETKHVLAKPLIVVGLACLCNLLWGSAIPFINLGYRHFDIQGAGPASLILFAGCRFFLAGLLTVLFASVGQKRVVHPNGKGWGLAAILACVQTVGQYVFFYIGVANTPSMNASIIQGLGPFVSILIAAWIFRTEQMSGIKWLGGILCIVGILFVHWQRSGSLSVTLTGEGFLLVSMSAGACSSALIKRFSRLDDPVALSGWQFMFGGMAMALAGLAAGGQLRPDGAAAFGILGYLALLSAVAYTVWALLLKHNPVSRIAPYMSLQPIFGVVLALIFFGQETTLPFWRYAAALVFICAGILLEERSAVKKQ